jgi:hypothetical protein
MRCFQHSSGLASLQTKDEKREESGCIIEHYKRGDMLQMMWYVIFLIRGEPLTIKATKVLHTTAYAILTRWVAWHFALDYS